MSKTKLFSIVVFIILTLAIVAGVILVGQNQDIREKAAPATNITFNPQSVTTTKGGNFTTNSRISTNMNVVTGIDIELHFSPGNVTLTQLVPTSALAAFTNSATGQVLKNEINNTTGRARFEAFTNDRNLGISGNLDILTITGTVSNSVTVPSAYQIGYTVNTIIAAVDEGQNVVFNKQYFNINVTGPTASPSPSPSPSPTASPSLMPTASPSASPSASPTQSPTPVFPAWDVNEDGHIDLIDIGLVVDDIDSLNPVTPRADVDGDGAVTIIDIGMIVDYLE